MPIVTQCDSCGKKYRIPDHQAGNFLPCKNCGEDMYVDDGGVAGTAPLTRHGSSGRSSTSNEGGLPGWAVWVMVGAGGLALLLIVGLIVGGMSGGGSEDDQGTQQVAQNDQNETSTPPSVPSTAGGTDRTSRPRQRATGQTNRNSQNKTTTNNENPFKPAAGTSGSPDSTKVTNWSAPVDPVPPNLASIPVLQAEDKNPE